MIKEYGIKAAKYALLPGIIPRVGDIFFSGFASVSYVMALLLVMTGLLPKGHEALREGSFGKYGVRRLFAEAANRIVLKKENIDQILIFLILLLGFVLVIMQLLSIIFSFVISSAEAAMPTWTSFFVTDNPDTDVAYMLLDQIFGIPEFFNSKYSTDINRVFPTPFHTAMQSMFSFYSNAILMVAIIIVIYYIFVVVAETAQTGVPFGERFASIYAPLRLIIAVGLLVPLGYGYNGAQYIVLQAAKWGSSLGTNSWLNYNSTVTNIIGINSDRLVAQIKTPSIGYVVEFMHVVKVCQLYYNYTSKGDIEIKPYLVKFIDAQDNDGILDLSAGGNFDDAMEFYKGGSITINFGEIDSAKYPEKVGNMSPYCGKVIIDVSGDINVESVRQITQTYFDIIMHLWNLAEADLYARRVLGMSIPDLDPCSVVPPGPSWGWEISDDNSRTINNVKICNEPPVTYLQKIVEMYQIIFASSVDIAIANQKIDASALTLDEKVAKFGWGGAGIWFNNLSKINSSIASVIVNIPRISRYPYIMESVMLHKLGTQSNIASIERFNPVSPDGEDIYKGEKNEPDSYNAALAFYRVLEMFQDSKVADSDKDNNKKNVLEILVNIILGGSGLLDIREQTNVHPLAQLSAIGSGLINQTLRHLFGAFVGSAIGEILNSEGMVSSQAYGQMIGQIFSSFAIITFTLGFLLGYVLPLVPFMYFFFAVARWVKSIFEAMVAAPLWALAHLSIDGDGIPGQAASQGYFLVLEIFLRPILTIFGLLAALAVFEAMTTILYILFDAVTTNALGYDEHSSTANLNLTASIRREMDGLYFTILYTIMMYVLAITSFKLIDDIPQNVMRWLGSSAKAFGDGEDAMESMTKYASISTAMYVAPALTKASVSGGSGLGKAISEKINKMKEEGNPPEQSPT